MYQKQVLKQMKCRDCGVNMGVCFSWKTKCLACWRKSKEQKTAPKNEVEHMSPEVHQMILKRIAERKQREKEQ
jgi:hypothetical protein